MPLSVNCPECRELLEVDDEYRAWQVRCPRCRHEFTPDRAAAAGVVVADDSDEYPLPPRSRRRGRRLSDEEIVDRAKRIVAGPASWLRVLGGLAVFFGLLGVAGTVAAAVWLADNPKAAAAKQGEDVVNVIVLGICSVLSVVCGGLTMFGALKLGRLESHGWAVAAGVLAISSVIFCGLCGMVTMMPFGIWVLVAVNKPEVKAGFDVVARGRRFTEPRYDDDED